MELCEVEGQERKRRSNGTLPADEVFVTAIVTHEHRVLGCGGVWWPGEWQGQTLQWLQKSPVLERKKSH